MKVSVIIPTINQLELTKLCVESVFKNTRDIEHELVVVDNASTDNTVDYLKEKGIFYLANRENLGVAKAWNQGIKASKGEYVCIINNDIVASAGWLSALVEFYEKHTDAGIVSPGTRWGGLDYDFDGYAAGYTRKMKDVTKDGYAGWCMLIKRDRFAKTGYFCEDYRVGTFEDTDFYLSLKKAGYASYITGCAFVHHFGSRTLKVMRRESPGFEDENMAKFNEKWGVTAESYFERKRKSLFKFLNNAALKLTKGHTLDERRPK
jgi:N-acetylglucosaminyl-diphospho-decaprenol L-rhamnosyltransferase